MLAIPNRPFATEKITGLMVPDGLFEITLGNQRLNAHIRNDAGTALEGAEVYIEGTSDPGIGISPAVQPLGMLAPGASHLVSWDLDLSGATPGTPVVSFVVDGPGGRQRIFKKIFVTQVTLDPSGHFSVHVPEGRLRVKFEELAEVDCCGKVTDPTKEQWERLARAWRSISSSWRGHDPDFELCPPPFLPIRATTEVTYNDPFDGQYGPLPYEDPFWKVFFCLLGLVLLIAAAIAEATSGTGSVEVTAGEGGTTACETCGVGASGGGSSYAAAGLVAAAAVAFGIAAASDERDPWRRGQDETEPEAGELTVGEEVELEFKPIDDVRLGEPFKVGLDWRYRRITDSGNSYEASASDERENIHTLSEYKVAADETFARYSGEYWVVEGRFWDGDKTLLRGPELLVRCLLCGPNGEYVVLPMQDDGQAADENANDGTYTGRYNFREQKKAQGVWTYYVVAQDVNHATPDLTPEEAAQIIGGIVRTKQLTLGLEGGTCPYAPDGHVQVV